MSAPQATWWGGPPAGSQIPGPKGHQFPKLDVLGTCLSAVGSADLGCLTGASNPSLQREQLWVLGSFLITGSCGGDGVCGDIRSQPFLTAWMKERLLLFTDEWGFFLQVNPPVFFNVPLGTAFQGLIQEFVPFSGHLGALPLHRFFVYNLVHRYLLYFF